MGWVWKGQVTASSKGSRGRRKWYSGNPKSLGNPGAPETFRKAELHQTSHPHDAMISHGGT